MKKKHRFRQSLRDRVFIVSCYIIIGLFALLCLLPIWYVLVYSLTPYNLYLKNPTSLIPEKITFDSYIYLLKGKDIWNSYASTLFITFFGTLISMTMLCIFSYPLSKPHLKGRRVINFFIMFTMYFSGGLIPTYALIRRLGMLDSYWALIIPGCLGTGNVILMRSFMRTIPDSLTESAEIDGANDWVVFLKIVLPLCLPALATFTLFSAVGYWNSYFSAVVYISTRKKWPLMLMLREMIMSSSMLTQEDMAAGAHQYVTAFTTQMAAIIFTTLPIMCVYPFLQKYFMKGLTLGGVKG